MVGNGPGVREKVSEDFELMERNPVSQGRPGGVFPRHTEKLLLKLAVRN
jgi:hypothetical protein